MMTVEDTTLDVGYCDDSDFNEASWVGWYVRLRIPFDRFKSHDRVLLQLFDY